RSGRFSLIHTRPYHKFTHHKPHIQYPPLMSGYDPERSFGFLLHDVSRLLRKRFDRRARTIGLTRAQWFVMAHLSRNEGLHQSALADIREIERDTALHH